jgi:pimeloyl-ACP methyl ester carboxylesterase
MRTLHALIIGIDTYPMPVRQLKGCVNDATFIDNYLKKHCQLNGWQYKPLILLNDKAKKADVIAGYNIFEKAKDGDTCVVYYSGHGSRIKAAREFWTETDGMNETIVCWDSRSGSRDLIDKELAFLSWKATQGRNVHFVEIMDCCFSGGNTRAVADDTADDRFETPQYEGPLISDYLGYEVPGAYRKSEKGVAAPITRKIHLSASKADETSKEKVIGEKRRGIFTWALINVLEQLHGNISYSELIDRAYFLVQQGVFELKARYGGQSPQMDQHDISPEALFLSGQAGSANSKILVGHDPEKGWILKAGAVHGLPESFNSTVLINDHTYPIKKVYATYATLDLPESVFDIQQLYFATVSDLVRNKVKIDFSGDVDADMKTNISQVSEPVNYPFIEIENTSGSGVFQVHRSGNYLTLTKKDSLAPLFPPVESNDIADFMHKVNKVGKWRSALDTDNPRAGFLKQQIELKFSIYQADDNYEKNRYAGSVYDPVIKPVLYYQKKDGENLNPKFGLTITNKSQQTIWFNILYLGTTFRIVTVNQEKAEIPPGKSFVLQYANDEKIPVSINTAMRDRFDVSEITDWLKILWSTEEFDTLSYHQSAISFSEDAARDLGDENPPIKKEPVSDWGSFSIPLNIICPKEQGAITSDNSILKLMNHTITAPSGFSAKIAITSSEEGTRAVGIALPAILQESSISDYEVNRSISSTPPGNVIELNEVQGAELITREHPLELTLPEELKQNESLWVFGFDQASGMYFPVGLESSTSQVNIHTLPDPEEDKQRSVGGSIKLFLKKITFNKSREILLGKPADDRKLYRLAIATYQEDVDTTLYESDLSLVTESVQKSKRIIICIHGILGDTAHMVRSLHIAKNEQGEKIADAFDLVLAYDYENLNTPIERLAELLKIRLEEAGFNDSDDKELIIMAHSMGGLISRYLIEKLGGDKLIVKLLQLGTPNYGSEWANVAQLSGVLMTHVINFTSLVKPAQWVLQGLGKLAKEGQVNLMSMHPDSDFMKKLNDNTPPPIQYTIIAGDMRLVSTADIKSFWGRFFTRLGYNIAGWLFDEANDIAVSRKNMIGTSNPNKKVIDLACDHMNYFYDQKTLEEIVRELS